MVIKFDFYSFYFWFILFCVLGVVASLWLCKIKVFFSWYLKDVFRVMDMIKDAWGFKWQNDCTERQRALNGQIIEDVFSAKYAPYILQNLTSLPLSFRVYKGLVNADDYDVIPINDESIIQPNSSVPVYINESSEEQLFRNRPARSSDRISDKQSNAVAHHFITVQLDGTSVPSSPISIDLVGSTFFEVNFSEASSKALLEEAEDASMYGENIEEIGGIQANNGFVVPVVFDVSVQRYSKVIRLYSTVYGIPNLKISVFLIVIFLMIFLAIHKFQVILLNSTPEPLELRFDIPFGVSPKVLK